jgi:hypothetical protein
MVLHAMLLTDLQKLLSINNNALQIIANGFNRNFVHEHGGSGRSVVQLVGEPRCLLDQFTCARKVA